MKIIIAGAGAVGIHLAKMLAKENQDIILLDENEERLDELDTQYDLMIKVGSPTSLQVLRECGAKHADLFVAVTPYESVNMTACMLAGNMGAKNGGARGQLRISFARKLGFFPKNGYKLSYLS